MTTLGEWFAWQRAHRYLTRAHPRLIAISGSSGVELARQALATALGDPVAGSQTAVNEIIAARRSQSPHRIILAIPAIRPGSIDDVARHLTLDVSILTNVQSANLDVFISKEMVAHEQASLVAVTAPTGTVCLNADDPLLAALAPHSRGKILYFGTSAAADIRLMRWHRLPSLALAAEFFVRGSMLEIHLPHLVGGHQLISIAAALAGVVALSGDVRRAARNIGQVAPLAGQLQLLTGKQGARVLDDTFDSTPESLLAALDTLHQLPAARRIAILGDIWELGAVAATAHEQIGQQAAARADVLILVGEHMRAAGAAALKSSSKKIDVHHFKDALSAGRWMSSFLQAEDAVLVAGSAAMNMTDVVWHLVQ